MGGREIKNALRMALAIASEEDCPLSHKLLMETSSMVKPISAFGNSYESDSDLSDAKDTKINFFWHFFVPSLLFLLLLVQISVLMLMLFHNKSEGDVDTQLPNRSFFNRLRK